MYIGVDLGGTNISIGIVDNNGKIKLMNTVSTNSEQKPQNIINSIINLINNTIKQSDTAKEDIDSIGIGIPGIINQETGRIVECINLPLHNVPLAELVKKEVKIPVFIDNDATLAGLAEHEIGVMKNSTTGVLMTIGTGIGGGIIIDGKLQTGYNGIGSEIGHMIVGQNDYDCNCGRNGCLETFASARALVNYTKKLIKQGNIETSLHKICNGEIDKIDGKMIFEQAVKGDKLANKAVDRMVKFLSIGIMNLISVIDPQVIALGGGISNAGDFFLEKVKTEVNNLKYFKTMPVGKIMIAKLRNEAGIIGAAMLGKYWLNK